MEAFLRCTRENQEEHNTDADTGVGDIEHRPPVQVVLKDGEVEKVQIEKVDHAALKQRPSLEEDPVEDPVNQIAQRATENHRQGNAETEAPGPDAIKIIEDPHARQEGKDGEEDLSADLDAECHPRIFDMGQPEEVSQERTTRTQRHPFPPNAQGRNVNPPNKHLRHLVCDEDYCREQQHAHGILLPAYLFAARFCPSTSLPRSHGMLVFLYSAQVVAVGTASSRSLGMRRLHTLHWP